jgi:alkylhydroperoxidase family enzyme
VSGKTQDKEIDLASVNGAEVGDAGVEHGAVLVAFAEAAMAQDDAALRQAREAVREALGSAAYVDACAVIGAFNVVDRIADATGIPLDDGMLLISADVRAELELARFASSANSPAAR